MNILLIIVDIVILFVFLIFYQRCFTKNKSKIADLSLRLLECNSKVILEISKRFDFERKIESIEKEWICLNRIIATHASDISWYESNKDIIKASDQIGIELAKEFPQYDKKCFLEKG